MTDIIKEELKQRIKDHEGYRLDPYEDTLGFLTGGYGHKILEDEEVPTTKEGWEELFEKDFQKAWDSMLQLCEVHELTIQMKAKCILCEMIFQMGYAGVSKFKNMIKSLKDENYYSASQHMLDSRWANQTPNRAKALSDLMASLC